MEKKEVSRINFIFLKFHCVVVEIFGSEYLEYLRTINCSFHLISSLDFLLRYPKGIVLPSELRLLPRISYERR